MLCKFKDTSKKVYDCLVSHTDLKCLDDIISKRAIYRPTTLGLIRSLFEKSNVNYTNEDVYNTLDDVSLRYVMSE